MPAYSIDANGCGVVQVDLQLPVASNSKGNWPVGIISATSGRVKRLADYTQLAKPLHCHGFTDHYRLAGNYWRLMVL